MAWASEDLERALAGLTAQQAAGVVRIVQAELEGRSLASLLDCADQICTSTTFYGSGRRVGWNGRPAFREALELARLEYRAWLLAHGTGEALLVLAEASPEAARVLRHQVRGDDAALAVLVRVLEREEDVALRKDAARALGKSGQARIVPALVAALGREENAAVRQVLVEAIGTVAGWRDREQATAALGVLDRADVRTAAKRALTIGDGDIDEQIERELAALAGGGEGAVVGAVAGEAAGGAAE